MLRAAPALVLRRSQCDSRGTRRNGPPDRCLRIHANYDGPVGRCEQQVHRIGPARQFPRKNKLSKIERSPVSSCDTLPALSLDRPGLTLAQQLREIGRLAFIELGILTE